MSLDPTTDATLRIGDADREHAAAALGRHLSVGRLTMAEFENRRHRLRRHNPRRPRRRSGRPTRRHPAVSTASTGPVRANTAAALGASSALGVSGELGGSGALGGVDLTGAICLLIWTATSAAQGHLHYFWPFWVIGPSVRS